MTAESGTPLNDIIEATAQAVADDPAQAQVVFAADGVAEGAVGSAVTAGKYTVRVDEPAALGGDGTAPNPVEFYLAALISCQVVTYRFWAQRLGIEVGDLRISAEGDLDVRGFFGLEDGVRAGFQQVRVTVHIDGPEPAQRYAELQQVVDARCPVLDISTGHTPVRTILVTPELEHSTVSA
ncbi:OsmC family protein [Nocardia spumae]|uniref:OsmC family protein n=1 Tax=Nocardia spumae TaxID=2887190 RepID=UPI001D15D5A3|nr:OsmC family protein [Nocardia spumae]